MTAEQLLKLLETQPFADFYNREFDEYITGEEGCMTRPQMIERVAQLIEYIKEL